MLLEIWTSVDEDSVGQVFCSLLKLSNNSSERRVVLQFAFFGIFKMQDAGGDTTCAFDGIANKNKNALDKF